MKKIYNTPQMKVVEVKNDIIATSPDQFDDPNKVGAQGRQDFFEDDDF